MPVYVKRALLTKLLLLFLIINSFAQFADSIVKPYKDRKDQFYHSILKTNLLPALWGNIPMTGEYRLVYEFSSGIKSSFEISISYLGKSLLFMSVEDTVSSPPYSDWIIKGFRFQIGYKYYILKRKALTGTYIAPFFSYANARFSTSGGLYSNDYVEGTHIDYNMIFGYQIINNRIALDLFIGAGFRKKTWIENTPQSRKQFDDADLYLYDSPIRFIIGFNYGLSF